MGDAVQFFKSCLANVKKMDFNTESIPEIIDDIEQHRESMRMRKILYGLTNKVWENDPTTVQGSSLYSMLRDLTISWLTMQKLVGGTHNLIQSLNRQEVYIPIAKDFLYIVAPLYDASPDDVNDYIQETILEETRRLNEQVQKKNYLNLMEPIVKEEIYTELQKLPTNIAKFISIAEVATYALNRLPPTYVASEEGKKHQLYKIEQMRGEIHTAVLQGIGAVMRDPLRKSTPLNMDEVDTFSTAHEILVELEEFVRKLDDIKGKISLEDLTFRIKLGIQSYNSSLAEIEQALNNFGIEHDKITAKNLGLTIRKLLRRLEAEKDKEQEKPSLRRRASESRAHASRSEEASLDAQQTSIREFLEDHQDDDNGDETFATSIRDWYSF
ncbi:MAG: late competence development ComFB family protein [Synechocystis sp.]|nr:late competence development ComFB family protein [Synechocystis sp.]